MRLLHVAHNFPPEFEGGTERYLLQLARGQSARGHQVRVACGSEEVRPGGEARPFQYQGIEGVRLHRLPRESYRILPSHPRMAALVLQAARDHGAELVHLHHWFHLDIALVRTLEEAGFPVVVTFHDFYPLCPRFFRVRPGREEPCPPGQGFEECEACLAPEAPGTRDERLALLEERARNFAREIRAARALIFFSRALEEFYRAWPHFPSRPVQVLPPGIPEAELWREARGAPPEGPPWKVGFWGGICHAKGLDLLVEALAAPPFQGKVELHLWGPVLERAFAGELQRKARERGLPLRLWGPVPWRELPRLAAPLAAAVFPSRCFETYGLAVDEALSLGVPALVSRRGALPERLGRGGRTFAPGDPEDLARVLAEVLPGEGGVQPARGLPNQVPEFARHLEDLEDLYLRVAE